MAYCFNRRNLPDGLDDYLIRRAVECAAITYDQLKAGVMAGGAKLRLSTAPTVAQLAFWIRRSPQNNTRIALLRTFDILNRAAIPNGSSAFCCNLKSTTNHGSSPGG